MRLESIIRIYYYVVLSLFILFGTRDNNGKETEMNKFISRIISLSLSAGILCTTCAFAADPITATKNDSTVTVTVKELNPGEETTLFVVNKDISIAEAFADTQKVFYIDQTVADTNGTASFSFSQTDSAPLDIYSGYSSMSDTDDPYKTVLDESAGSGGSEGGEYILGDVNGDEIADGEDATAIIYYYLKGTAFAYEHGVLAANVNGDDIIDGEDATAVIYYYLKGTPFTKE